MHRVTIRPSLPRTPRTPPPSPPQTPHAPTPSSFSPSVPLFSFFTGSLHWSHLSFFLFSTNHPPPFPPTPQNLQPQNSPLLIRITAIMCFFQMLTARNFPCFLLFYVVPPPKGIFFFLFFSSQFPFESPCSAPVLCCVSRTFARDPQGGVF